MTVVRTDYFSRTCLVTMHLPLVSYRTRNCFGVRCCDTCGRFMTCSADPTRSDGFRSRCFTRNAVIRCRRSLSIRDGSWFQQSNLTLLETLLITYDIVCREPAHRIQSEYSFGSHTTADWGTFCREVMLVYLERSSVKICGPNKTVEIDESKLGRRKYHRGHPVKGQ